MNKLCWFVVIISLVFSPLSLAKTLGIFVTNFASFSSQKSNEVRNLFSEQIKGIDTLAIVNAIDASILLLKDKTNLSNTQIEQLIQTVYQLGNTTQGASTVNLTASLYVVIDILRPLSQDYTKVEIFLIDSLYHKDSYFDFYTGYPNDGFLYLKDNDFSYLPPLTTNKQIHLHVLTTTVPVYSMEYQRFFTHLAKKLFNATLSSFNDKLTINLVAPLQISAIQQTSKSEVLQADKKPICAFEDKIDYDEKTDLSIIFMIKNPCRANSIVSFYHNNTLLTVQANLQGEVKLPINLQAGTNKVELLGIDNRHRSIYEKSISERDDQIKITVNNDIAHIVGANPLRQEGEKVSITHEASGRKWEVRVKSDNSYEVDIPLAKGPHGLHISRATGGSPQQIEVVNGANCTDTVDHHIKQATATIVVTNPCRANKPITFTYLNQKFPMNFGADGKVTTKISLYQEYNDVLFNTETGTDRRIEIRVPQINQLIKVTLIWDLPVDMDLHIYEPNAEERGNGHIYHANKNGKGSLDIDDRGSNVGTHVENYVVDSSTIDEGVIRVKIHYYTRTRKPTGDYCGNGRYASVPLQLLIFNKGQRQQKKITISSAPCDHELSPEVEYYLAETIRLP